MENGEAVDPLAGRRLGPYRLVERVGEGGMGTVYLGEREDQYRKRVAVKLVRRGLDSTEVLRRFQRERQTLANLSHPCIVGLLDGGVTHDGVSYLVMDFVDGLPIDEYCEKHKLSIAARLKLMLSVASAIQHAHQQLVVHCDLKPANIMVTADGTPRLLDFGIAKLLGPESETSDLTRTGQRPFTPDYASPEQLSGQPVAAATDVYALGVLLFGLLSGKSPYSWTTGSPVEMVHAICIKEPPLPSATADDDKRRRALQGDLDAIILKALRKEPRQRYGSVAELAADIERYLDGRPVLAHQDTFFYRTAKFLKRHRVALTSAAVVTLAIATGVTATLWQAHVAHTERARAVERFQDVRRLANYLLFDFHDQLRSVPGSTPLQAALVKRSLTYLDSLAKDAAGDPGLQLELAEAYLRLGDVQGNPYKPNLGETPGALESYRKARGLVEAVLRTGGGNRAGERALARIRQQTGEVLPGVGETARALEEVKAATAIFERLAGDSDQARVDLAACYESLGDMLGRMGSDPQGQLANYRNSLAQWEKVSAPGQFQGRALRAGVIVSMKLADIQAESDARGALAAYAKQLEALQSFPPERRAEAETRRIEAGIYRRTGDAWWEVGDYDRTLESYRQGARILTALAALDPANTQAQFDLASILRSAGETHQSRGDGVKALASYRQVAEVLRTLLRLDPTNRAWRGYLAEMLARIGRMLTEAGQKEESRRMTTEALALTREIAEPASASSGELSRAARTFLICEPADLRDPQRAIAYARRAIELSRGMDAYALDTLAEAQLQAGDKPGAIETVRKGLALLPPEDPAQRPSWMRRALEAKLAALKAR